MPVIISTLPFPPLVIILCLLALCGAVLASIVGESSDHSDTDDHGH